MNKKQRLFKVASESASDRFRGTIWENAKRFRLKGSAYDAMNRSCPEQDGYFDIASARHLTGPLLALQDPNVREVGVIGASQALKSVVGDIWTPYIIEHIGRNMAIYFEDDRREFRPVECIHHAPYLVVEWRCFRRERP